MVQFSSVVQSCPTLCGPVGCSTPGFPVLHQLSELVQTHVYWVSDASQPSHPLSSPSPPAFNLCQYQSLLQWVSSSHQVAKVWLDVPKIPSLEPGFEDKLSLDTMVEQAHHNHCRYSCSQRGRCDAMLESLLHSNSEIQLGTDWQFFDSAWRPGSKSPWFLIPNSRLLVLPSESYFFLYKK